MPPSTNHHHNTPYIHAAAHATTYTTRPVTSQHHINRLRHVRTAARHHHDSKPHHPRPTSAPPHTYKQTHMLTPHTYADICMHISTPIYIHTTSYTHPYTHISRNTSIQYTREPTYTHLPPSTLAPPLPPSHMKRISLDRIENNHIPLHTK